MKDSARRVDVRFGPTATGAALLEQAANVGYLHVLAHGVAGDGADAMRAGVLLTGPDGPRRFGEPLDAGCTAAALMARGTVASHVTLQACSLGRSRRALGDELWGFPRAVLAAGARSILAPLWDIDLASSSALLDRFNHLFLVERQPVWRALAEAMFEMSHTPGRSEWRHFYHWGAFRLTGFVASPADQPANDRSVR